MEYDAIWQAFAQTGDPVYYLLYKGLDSRAEEDSKEDRPGDALRVTD